jgi:hypothetical protein
LKTAAGWTAAAEEVGEPSRLLRPVGKEILFITGQSADILGTANDEVRPTGANGELAVT